MGRQVDGATAVIQPHVRGTSLLMQVRNVSDVALAGELTAMGLL
jgi:hypothetical protein